MVFNYLSQIQSRNKSATAGIIFHGIMLENTRNLEKIQPDQCKWRGTIWQSVTSVTSPFNLYSDKLKKNSCWQQSMFGSSLCGNELTCKDKIKHTHLNTSMTK